jgi:hypothetical protein
MLRRSARVLGIGVRASNMRSLHRIYPLHDKSAVNPVAEIMTEEEFQRRVDEDPITSAIDEKLNYHDDSIYELRLQTVALRKDTEDLRSRIIELHDNRMAFSFGIFCSVGIGFLYMFS